MKKSKILLLAGLAFLSSCADLDYNDRNSIENPWVSENSGTLYLNNLYNQSLPSASFGANAMHTDETAIVSSYLSGQLDVGSHSEFSLMTYSRIREINIGIEKCEKSNLPQTTKEEFLGQMYFLRAYEYYRLTLIYGGVPLVFTAQDIFSSSADELRTERSTAKVCFERIIEDLDRAMKMCKPNMSDYGDTDRGRVTRMTAAAFKGRVYLTFASPLFNPQNDAERWKKAYEACLEAKSICQEQGRDLVSFNTLFSIEGTTANPETVWVVPYDYFAGKTHGWEDLIRPESMSALRESGPSCVPSQHLTDAFLMKDGRKIGESSTYGYDQQYYWLNRDDRFGATIAYNGSIWELNGIKGRKQWSYQGMQDDLPKYMALLGSFCRKASIPSILNENSSGERTTHTGVDWHELRYAEVLLNLAECANEAGHASEAYAELYAIRKRAGIEEGTNASMAYGIPTGLSKEDLREVIMNERFVEFAFEDKRFWDMRRRLMYTESLGANTPSMNERKNRYNYMVRPKAPHTAKTINAMRDEIDIDTQSSTYFNVIATRRDVTPINVPKRYYFFDIPTNVLERCITVEQTIGWTDGRLSGPTAGQPGTFDPLSDQGGTPWKDEL